MTAEGTFPKIKGDVFYPSEVNKMWNYVTDGTDGALAVTSGTTNINGLKRYTSISVSAGATLNLDDYASIFCSGDVTIEGTLTAGSITTTPTGGWIATTAGDGGKYSERGDESTYSGGGGAAGFSKFPLYLIALGDIILGASSVIDFSGGDGTNGASDVGTYAYGGSGAAGGSFFNVGGAGGTGSTNSTGTTAGATFTYAIDDYYTFNYYNRRAFIGVGGQGGEGGNVDANGGGNGAGKGGGGGSAGSHIFMMTFKDLTMPSGSTITVAGGGGGDGGDAHDSGEGAGGGGGGGAGGLVQLLYKKTLTNEGTITLSGGSGGAAGTGHGTPTAGASGGVGVSVIEQF